MLVKQAVDHFGSQGEVARVLGIGKAAVSKWANSEDKLIPRAWAAELHIRTRGKLKFDPDVYQSTADDDAAA